MTASAHTERRLSTRFSRKGALIEETYAIFRAWDRHRDLRANLALDRRPAFADGPHDPCPLVQLLELVAGMICMQGK